MCSKINKKKHVSRCKKKKKQKNKLLRVSSSLFRRSVCGQPARTLSLSVLFPDVSVIWNASFADVRVWMFCHNMDWLFQNLHMWCEDDGVFFNHLCGYASSMLLFLVWFSAEMAEKWNFHKQSSINKLQRTTAPARQSSEITDAAHDGSLMIFLIALFQWNEL